jgi:hypothetical protein
MSRNIRNQLAVSQPPGPRGYVLLVTLLLLAVVAATLATLSRASLGRSSRASDAEEELQRRWGMLSCEATILPQAEPWLTRQEQGQQPVATLGATIRLGGQTFQLILADEQGKANLNALYAWRGRARTQRTASRLVRIAASPLPVSLRTLALPSQPRDQENQPMQPIGSFTQVFSRVQPSSLIARSETRPAIADLITLWGDGRLNFERTSLAVLKEACQGVLTSIDLEKLSRLRTENPGLTGVEVLTLLDLSDEAWGELAEHLLTDESACHSLWIVATSRRGDVDRSFYRLTVEESGQIVQVFTW